MHALIVEDEPETRLLLEALLQARGHQVTACADAEIAWERTRLPVYLAHPHGPQYWLEVDIQDDPPTTQRKNLLVLFTGAIADHTRCPFHKSMTSLRCLGARPSGPLPERARGPRPQEAGSGFAKQTSSLFEAAEGGTLFLDEIGDMPLSVQTSLLRVLQEREGTRLGESRPRFVSRTHTQTARSSASGLAGGRSGSGRTRRSLAEVDGWPSAA